MGNASNDGVQQGFVSDDFAALKRMVLAGASPDTIDPRDGSPILLRATVQRDLAAVNFLIEQRANVNARGPRNLTALHVAVLSGFVEIVQRLIEAGADTNARDAEGAPPFAYALASKNQDVTVEMAKMLIAHGADRNLKNHQGRLLLDVYKELTGNTYEGI